MLKKIIEKLENKNLPLWQVVGCWWLIIFLRTLIENFSSHPQGQSFDLFSVWGYFFHFPFSYLFLLLSLILFWSVLLKSKPWSIFNLTVYFSPIIFLTPIIDLFYTQGHGWQIAYFFVDLPALAWRFLHLGGSLYDTGVSIGIRFEVFFILLGVAIFFWLKSGKVVKTFLGTVGSYLIIFIFLSLPSLIMAGNQIPISTATNQEFWGRSAGFMAWAKGYLFTDLETAFNFKMSLIYLLLIWWLSILLFWLQNKKKFWAVVKNMRLLRMLFFLSLSGVGMLLSFYLGFYSWQHNFFNIISLLIFGQTFASAWLLAVIINDWHDQDIDLISNSNRPFVTGLLAKSDLLNLSLFFLWQIVCGGLVLGWYTFIFFLAFSAIYYIYSAPPWRWKKYVLINNLLVAANGVLMILLGFFFASDTLNLNDLPLRFVLGLLVILGLSFNLKDLKDYNGDKKDQIYTLCVIMGEKLGRRVIGFMIFFAFLLVPMVFLKKELWLLSLIFGLIFFLIVNLKKIKEKYYFLLYFFYLAIAVLLLF